MAQQKRYVEAKLVASEICEACDAAFEPGTIAKVYQTDEKGLCEHGKRVERKTPDGRKIFTYRCTGGAIDRDKEILSPDGWDFSAYEKNPVIMDSHDYRGGIHAIIGRAIPPLRRDADGWDVDVVYAKSAHSLGPLAQDLVEEGMLNAVSVGFISGETEKKPNEPRKHLKQELLEISNVAIPSYRDALRVASFAETVPTGDFGVRYLAFLADGNQPLPNDQFKMLLDACGEPAIVSVETPNPATVDSKVSDFNTLLEQTDTADEVRERRWELNSVLTSVLRACAQDQESTIEDRVATVETSLGQYAIAMLDWFKTLTALPAETQADVVCYLSVDSEIAETKAGAALSAKTKKQIQKSCDEIKAAHERLMAMMAMPDTPGEMPDGGKTFLVLNHRGVPVGNVNGLLADAEKDACGLVNAEMANSPYTVVQVGKASAEIEMISRFDHWEKSLTGVLRTDIKTGAVEDAAEYFAKSSPPPEISEPETKALDGLADAVSAFAALVSKENN